MRSVLRACELRLFALICSMFFSSCNREDDDSNGRPATGHFLATKYCGSCHLQPDPTLLDKETWNQLVLPAMAKQLGLEVWQNNKYFQNERSAISISDWTQLVAYYDSLAPEQLPIPKHSKPLINDWSIFTLEKPGNDQSTIATTTLVSIDNIRKSIWSGDSERAVLYQWNSKLIQTEFTQLPSPVVAMNFEENGNAVLTCIGEMKAIDIPAGSILSLKILSNKTSFDTIASSFIRPIQTSSGDFNKDGLMDYVVSSFGHNKGGLYLLKQLADKSFQKSAIREIPGATQSITGDFNNDGWMDIMTLFAHGDEGIWLFTNDKKGGFETKNLLRFPPVYGSSSFQIVDMNADGKMDIVYTAGDNSDYSRILKPYHGVYVFSQTGNFAFKQSYFYPINGCTKAIAADFDQDGDVDIATIAFFADFKNNSSESFLYFENDRATTSTLLTFKQIAIPVSNNGRWICMDVNDMDGDGDQDIILGNYSKGFLNQDDFKPDWDVHTPFVVLKNNVRYCQE